MKLYKDKTMNKGLANPNANDGQCPYCGIYKEWSWTPFDGMRYVPNYDYWGYSSFCHHCNTHTIYYKEELIYPKTNLLIKPNALFDKYPKAKKLFLEAVEVSPLSPRAGLTLARMCLEALTNEILEKMGETIDDNFHNNIEKLHKLDIINLKLKTLLSSARVIGNKSTHNFNIVDTENEPNVEDSVVVLETIDYILENMRISSEKEEKLSQLEEKVRAKNTKKQQSQKGNESAK